MKHVFRISNELSKILQQKDQNIVNAMKMAKVSKQHLEMTCVTYT